MKSEDLNVPEILPLWVGLTSGAEFPTALPRDEALRRARELLGVLRKGTLSNRQIEADEDLKHVLYALCELLREPGREGQLLLDDANAVYHFIESVQWPDDVLEEKSELLLECAEIGWGAIGLSVAEITRRRLAEPLAELHDFTADPISDGNARRQAGVLCDPKYNNARLTPFAMDTARAERSSELLQELSNPDVVGAICRELRSVWNNSPSMVAEEATDLFESIKSAPCFGGLFDEKDYFLGEAAILAAGAHRLLGNRELTERWLDRADTSFRHTVNPSPLAAEVAYLRLALRYDMGRHDEVLELAPSLIRSFEKLGMHREAAKAGLLQAVALKVTGQTSEALVLLEQIREKSALIADSHLQGRLLVDIGDAHQIEGRVSEALAAYREALTLLQTGNTSSSLAELKLVVGALFRGQGHLDQSLESLQSSVRDFEAMSMSTRSAYVRVLIADTLIAMSRPREAEREILAALPTIEEHKMVPEGFAAVALLKESVRRRKTDPNALRELREHLQASK